MKFKMKKNIRLNSLGIMLKAIMFKEFIPLNYYNLLLHIIIYTQRLSKPFYMGLFKLKYEKTT